MREPHVDWALVAARAAGRPEGLSVRDVRFA